MSPQCHKGPQLKSWLWTWFQLSYAFWLPCFTFCKILFDFIFELYLFLILFDEMKLDLFTHSHLNFLWFITVECWTFLTGYESSSGLARGCVVILYMRRSSGLSIRIKVLIFVVTYFCFDLCYFNLRPMGAFLHREKLVFCQ